MKILAHRGTWSTASEQNSLAALNRALADGHGIETDVRDRGDELVIVHDAFAAPHCTLAELATILGGGPIALNVKADGLAPRLARQLSGDFAARSFYFDMSVPDMRAYLVHGLPVFTRHSDVEPEPAYYAAASGVWLDSLEGPFSHSINVVRSHLANGKKIAIVSEELHKRDHTEQWRALAALKDEVNVYLCTDLVAEAAAAFG